MPKGFYVDTKSNVDTGLVVTDNVDSEGYSTGNEWVWVPVNSSVGNNDFYYSGTGIVAGTDSVNFSKYSKLYDFTTTNGVTTKIAKSEVKPSATSGYGNYAAEAVTVGNSDTTITVKPSGSGTQLKTGQTSYTRRNNIYDMPGNCYDWTQEAFNAYSRVLRRRLLQQWQ